MLTDEEFARALRGIKQAGVTLEQAAEAYKKLGMSFAEVNKQLKELAVAQNRELIARLRERYELFFADDWDVLVVTNGTLGRAIIELKMAWEAWWKEVWK